MRLESHLRSAGAAIALAALLIALAALLAGCGGSSTTSLSYHPPGYQDWPYFGRDRDNTRFAPQKQIDASNVSRLGIAWSNSLGAEQYLMESFPVVVGQTIYLTTSTDEVVAIDAVTGHTKWIYTPSVDFSLSTGVGGYGVSVNRGVAVEDGKLFMVTFDDRLQAVSQATGEELWSTSVVDDSTGAYETMAPTVYDGRVFVGDSGSEDGVRGFVAAYSASTGKQLWRFYTVPHAGTGWVPKEGGGGTVYMPPTIDTSTGIVYVGTGNPAPAIVGTKRPGPDLYTDSILALRASTGQLVWYHQEVAHDLWDYDAESPPVLFTTKVKGRSVRAVAEAGKSGYLFILNAATGADLFPRVAFVKEDHTTPTTKGTLECPGAVGGSQYAPLAFDPEAGDVYVSGINNCQILTVNNQHYGEKDFGGDRHHAVEGETVGNVHRRERHNRQGRVGPRNVHADDRRGDGYLREHRVHRRSARQPLRVRSEDRQAAVEGRPRARIRVRAGDLHDRRPGVRAGGARGLGADRLGETGADRRGAGRAEARRQPRVSSLWLSLAWRLVAIASQDRSDRRRRRGRLSRTGPLRARARRPRACPIALRREAETRRRA